MTARQKTKYPNIYKYQTKKGVRYQVRTAQVLNGQRAEFYKGGILTLAEAKAILADVELKFSQGIHPNNPSDDSAKGDYTFDEYYQRLREFKLASKKWNLNTLDTNNLRWDKLKGSFGHMKLSELNRIDYQKWINQQYKYHDYSQATVEGFHTMLMMIINDAVEEDFLDKNRLKKVTLTKEGYKPKEKMITMKEYEEVIKTCQERLEPVHFTMFYLSTFGLRRGEINGIRKDAIEYFPHGNETLAKVYIGTSRTRRYPQGNKPKTEKSDRFILVNDQAATLLKEQIQRAKKIKSHHDQILNESDFIFLNPETAEPFYVEMMNDQLKKIKKETGINIHPHKMRHMFATAANLADADEEVLRNFMGHSNEAMTKHYTHHTDEGALKLLQQTDTILHKRL